MMSIPKNLLYTTSHEWMAFEDDHTAKVGITDYAQQALGDIVFVNLPMEGDEVTKEESCADVESVKAVSDIYSPATGVINAINEEIMDQPGSINSSCYDAWLFVISDITDKEELLTAEQYEAYCEEQEG